MGAVYRASHAMLRRPTAIKLLAPERSGQIDLARFEREVQMTSQLASPHTVSVYDYGRTPDGIFYYAMEYLDGITSRTSCGATGRCRPRAPCTSSRRSAARSRRRTRVGLIHRDIKPANILLCERGGTPDLAKVVDFGLVKNVDGLAGGGLTSKTSSLGTPHYMAPEAISSPDRMDARSDLYAVGAVALLPADGQSRVRGADGDGHLHPAPALGARGAVRAPRPSDPGRPRERRPRGAGQGPDRRPESARALREALLACGDVPPGKRPRPRPGGASGDAR